MKFSIFLLAGAIINVAVAWGCALWSTARYTEEIPQHGNSGALDGDNRRRGAHVRLHPGVWHWAQSTVIGAQWRQMLRNANGQPADAMQQHFAGLPMRAFYCTGNVILSPTIVQGELISPVQWDGGFDAPQFLKPQHTPYLIVPSVKRPVPYLLIMPGFAINTIFYAAILWGLFAVPFALRRRRVRIKRGQCAACGYSLRGLSASGGEKCPECGAGVRCSGDRSVFR